MSDSEKEEVCKICGNPKISAFHSYKRFGKGTYYCSFKCNAIGERRKLLIFSFVFLVISIGCIVMLALEPTHTVPSIIVSVFSFVITLFFLVYGLTGYIAKSKRIESEKDERQYTIDEKFY